MPNMLASGCLAWKASVSTAPRCTRHSGASRTCPRRPCQRGLRKRGACSKVHGRTSNHVRPGPWHGARSSHGGGRTRGAMSAATERVAGDLGHCSAAGPPVGIGWPAGAGWLYVDGVVVPRSSLTTKRGHAAVRARSARHIQGMQRARRCERPIREATRLAARLAPSRKARACTRRRRTTE
jgi:hypothetical protein